MSRVCLVWPSTKSPKKRLWRKIGERKSSTWAKSQPLLMWLPQHLDTLRSIMFGLGLSPEILMVIIETRHWKVLSDPPKKRGDFCICICTKKEEVQSLGKSKYLRKCKRRKLIFIPWILISLRAKKKESGKINHSTWLFLVEEEGVQAKLLLAFGLFLLPLHPPS